MKEEEMTTVTCSRCREQRQPLHMTRHGYCKDCEAVLTDLIYEAATER